MPLAGKRLSYLQTARLAHKHGIPLGEKLIVCVAICEWESRRYTKAWNFNARTKDRSYGLWQINMLGKLMEARLKEYGLKSPSELYNPDANARAMVKISNHGANWRPWGAYTNGNYKKSLKEARTAVEQLTQELKPKPHRPVLPPVSLRKLIFAATHPADEEPENGVPDTTKVQIALVKVEKLKPGFTAGSFDVRTREAYSKWQESLGYRGTDANGVPGKDSLTKLGTKTQLFRVVS